jgi:Asp-tRNA(Asn)/Glu-tRNA(Gln) amidotransferase A subunit family amidase
MQVDSPPLYFPIYHMNDNEWLEAHDLSKNTESRLHYHSELILARSRHYSIQDYANIYRNGTSTPTRVMRKALESIKKLDSAGLKIFTSVLDFDVLLQASESDARFRNGNPLGVLDGVPIVVKDMIDVAGHSICNGEHPMKCIKVDKDDPLVARFRAQGAIILGVTIMTEGGVTPLGYNSHYGGPHSSFSPKHYSGGSSSGCAVAVASGIVPVAIGFDGGGSIRLPSSLSGLHGLAPTFSRVPFNNRTDSTMIKAGPMTNYAYDAAIAYEVMAQPLPGHFYSALYGDSCHNRGSYKIEREEEEKQEEKGGCRSGPPPPHSFG